MVEASSQIGNFSSMFVRPNEQVTLTCSIEAPQPTDFVYWYKNDKPIHFDKLKSRRSAKHRAQLIESANQQLVDESDGPEDMQSALPANHLVKSSSALIIKRTQLNDSANYTCLVS